MWEQISNINSIEEFIAFLFVAMIVSIPFMLILGACANILLACAVILEYVLKAFTFSVVFVADTIAFVFKLFIKEENKT
ncbi:hypothetical protein QJU83_02180 [Pasteurella skyensis]|uniref:hypothetical protein n=1 Tax=Phocoenobacter skyensis TaxID=97481 RepID=UPI00274EFF75|nr:hypothetical protein [Pasteurella skyensis]MDP8176350.1 hypothetical protein [Pasteurella skyensis]MDP8199137.1 hypothetical protein [Pasteurella skyensis]